MTSRLPVAVVQRVHVEEVLPAPVEAAWQLIRDFGDISAWAPHYRIIDITGEGAGAVRRVWTPHGMIVIELLAQDDAAHCLTYTMHDSPWPVRRYVATVRMHALNDRSCSIQWFGRFEPIAGFTAKGEQALRNQLAKLYQAYTASLRRSLAMPKERPRRAHRLRT